MTKGTQEQTSIVPAKDAVSALASAGAAATSAMVVSPAAATSALAFAALLVAIFPPVLAAMTEAGVRRMKMRGDRFFNKIVDEWARDEEKTHEEIAGQLEAAKDDPNVADAIWRAVRGLMEAPNDAAAIPLGVLVAEYTREKRAADAFFRGVVRLLQELEASEFDELRKLLDWVTSTTKRAEVDLVARNGAVDAALDDFVHDVNVDGEPDKRTMTDAVSDPGRMFGLLTANGLAVSLPGMRFDVSLPEITLRRVTAQRLLRLLEAG
ncbi:hypothetical protein [Sorangium sp. So ce854]|uniref:hypothetical protein n=1 Tax=Sorangium sp. So ce854 TaxID=3133322 RepID=UPI003F5EFBB3